MLAGVEAANTLHPEYAPHYAVSTTGGERVESDEAMSREQIGAAIERARSE